MNKAGTLAVIRGLLVDLTGEPDVGNLLVRFEEGSGAAEAAPGYSIGD